MKKKYLIIIIITLIVLITAGIVFFVIKNNGNYTVKVNLVDDYSPDRILVVYKDDKEIEYKEIHLMDDTPLCKYSNPSTYYGNVKNESELKIVLNNDKVVIAKVVKGD
jgi:hypothetical protein